MSAARRYEAVLFDLDGTLIDSIGLIVDSFHHTYDAFGVPRRSDAEVISGIGIPLRTVLATWAGASADVDAMVGVYREHNLAHHDARVRAYPGVVTAVRALAAGGVRLALVTSKSRHGAERGLAVAGLSEAIEVLVCSEDVTHAKPHREPVDRAVALLGADPRATLFVGDSIHDMRSGRAAEVGTGAALWGPFARATLEPAAPSHWLGAPGDVVRLALG